MKTMNGWFEKIKTFGFTRVDDPDTLMVTICILFVLVAPFVAAMFVTGW